MLTSYVMKPRPWLLAMPLVIDSRESTRVTPTSNGIGQGARMIPITFQTSSIFTFRCSEPTCVGSSVGGQPDSDAGSHHAISASNVDRRRDVRRFESGKIQVDERDRVRANFLAGGRNRGTWIVCRHLGAVVDIELGLDLASRANATR
ncbi:MAG: hypothetical protein QM784_18955 [Polyangiaceae bacterium]